MFLDTGFLLATVLPGDRDHAAAVRLARAIRNGAHGSASTSDYVLAEGLNFIRRKVRRPEVAGDFLALAFGSRGMAPLVRPLLRVHGTRFAAALDRYQREFERGLSFTDWTSIVLMEEERIGTIATFDDGFRGLVKVADGG